MFTLTISNLQLSSNKIEEAHAFEIPIEDLYKITHFHAVFFIKIIDFKAYLLLKVVIHIFLLEPNILKLNGGKNPQEMSPVFLNIPPKSKMKRSFPRACSGISADQNGLVRAQSTQSE